MRIALVLLLAGLSPSLAEACPVPPIPAPEQARDVRDLRGLVRDDRLLPVAGVEVSLYVPPYVDAEGVAWHRLLEVKTGADGTFSFSRVPRLASSLELSLSAKDFEDQREPVTGRTDVLDIRLSRSAVAEGRVLLESAPRGDASITFTSNFPEVIGDGAFLMVRFAEVDAEGRFRLVLPAGTSGVLSVRARGLPRREFEVPPLRAGETTPLGDLALERGFVLRGRIRDARTGAPLPGALVFSPGGFGEFEADEGGQADADGRYELAGLGPEDRGRSVSVSAVGFVLKGVPVPEEGDSLDIDLEAGASIVVAGCGMAFQTVPELHLEILGAEGGVLTAHSLELGQKVEALDAGLFGVTLRFSFDDDAPVFVLAPEGTLAVSKGGVVSLQPPCAEIAAAAAAAPPVGDETGATAVEDVRAEEAEEERP